MPEPRRFSLGESTLTPDETPPAVPRSLPPQKKYGKRILLWGMGMVLVGAAFLILVSARFTQSLQFENNPISFFEGIRLVGAGLWSPKTTLDGAEEGRINILLMGRAGKHYPGKNLTDTVMLLSVDTKGKRAALLSLPRDLLVPLPDTTASVKINTLYQYGLMSGEGAGLVKKSVSLVTGLPIHYFASIDFDGFEQVIDTLGGIRVEVMRDIHDTRYPGPNYSYETFDLQKGWQTLDGKTALKYARMRHNDPEGDFGRAKRQQQILQAVRSKAWSLPTFLNPVTFTQLLENLGDSVATDITPEAARAFLALAETVDTQTIATVVVDAWKKESLLRVVHIDTPQGRAFALAPRSGNWQEVQALAQNVFDSQATALRRQTIEKEAATVLVLVPTGKSALGNDLAQDIRETFPVKSVRTAIWPALKPDSQSSIIGTPESPLYTLDSLIGRYTLTREEALPLAFPKHFRDADLVILYTRSDIPGLSHEALPEDMGDFPEPNDSEHQ